MIPSVCAALRFKLKMYRSVALRSLSGNRYNLESYASRDTCDATSWVSTSLVEFGKQSLRCFNRHGLQAVNLHKHRLMNANLHVSMLGDPGHILAICTLATSVCQFRRKLGEPT